MNLPSNTKHRCGQKSGQADVDDRCEEATCVGGKRREKMVKESGV
jgi:hypothetical protein